MKRYIVTADYYNWVGGITDRYYWVITEESKIHRFIQRIKQEADADAEIAEVCTHVYELDNEVTDKFIND